MVLVLNFSGTKSLRFATVDRILRLRAKRLYIVFQDGWRAKLKARDGNEIDSMFIDKRASQDEKGQILVG